MLRILAIGLVILAIVACISAEEEARGLRDFIEDIRPPVNVRGSVRDAPNLHRVPPPLHREEEVTLSYVEKLLVREGLQKDKNEDAYVAGQPDPNPETLEDGIEPTLYAAEDEESSEERLQKTRQAAQSNLNRVNPESPCPSVFSYDGIRAGKERWYGVVLLTTDTPLTGIRLVIRLNKKAHLLGNWFGEVCSKDNIEFRIWNSRKKLVPGPPHSVKFFVKFGDKEVNPPRVRSILLNGKQICSSSGGSSRPQVASTPRTTVSRPTTSKPTVSRPTVSRPTPTTTATTVSRPVSRPPVTTTRKPGNEVDGVQCGTVEIQPSPFITHGQRSSRGQWPWHAALYQAKGTDLTYICGGTLIGKNSVLTAAHCVTKAYNGRPVDPETILVYLGKYHLNLWSAGGVQDKQVVGWGYDERGVVTEELMMAKMPVVSQQTCIWSYPAFFPRFTSEKTYCAGFRNGTSVCNGDSGGGMVFPIRDRPDAAERWHLRGLVSLGASQEDKRVCNTKHYVVFTDVAKYLDWIEQFMST
ncbi:hypothetical protein J437_LFUL015101 [Ladona fulva]|uniref:Peptidase S1 domain-containing protein n=1 Tax=Ladona fulva TaxID=123851 RepID=A0A8K0K1V0_LADFU|nr:hypothetical protein J437_LFUL015101 [Ladona fulva]